MKYQNKLLKKIQQIHIENKEIKKQIKKQKQENLKILDEIEHGDY